jgi:hypothetical protein
MTPQEERTRLDGAQSQHRFAAVWWKQVSPWSTLILRYIPGADGSRARIMSECKSF